jgi:hypothetical protein
MRRGADLVVLDGTTTLRGVEQHTFLCSEGHMAECRVVFMKDGREAESPPIPEHAARRLRRAAALQEVHVAGPGPLGRVIARLRGY